MPVRNQNWYDLQAGRRYPLDDRSTGLDDNGQLINDDILVDCNIQFPNTVGTCAFIQAINVSPNIVTVLIGAAVDLNATTSVTIGAVSLPKPVVANRNYAISALLPGVAGWLVFGYGIENSFSGRYATPIQTLLNPRNAKSYNALPITGLGKKSLNTLLTDLIVLEAESPVVIERKTLQINDKTANAVIFKLDATRNDLPYNPLQYFLGPCGQRPESGTCPKQPIETINGVAPDCDGNINIVADNLSLRAFENCGGLGIDLPIGLADTCAKKPYGPPRQPVDECAPSSSSTSSGQSSSASLTPGSSGISSISSSSESAICLALPLCQSFYAPLPGILTTRAGQFGLGQQLAPPPCTGIAISSSSSSSNSSSSSSSSLSSDSSLSSSSNSSSSSSSSSSSRSSSSSSSSSALPILTQRTVATALSITQLNIATLNNCATDWAIGRRISTDFKIVPGGQNNAGLLINYLTPQMNNGLTTYLVAGVDLNQNVFYLKRYNGSTFVNEFLLSLREILFVFDLNAWHTISIEPTINVNTGVVSLRCALKQTIAGDEVYFATSVENYGMISGATGLFSNNTLAHFSALRIE